MGFKSAIAAIFLGLLLCAGADAKTSIFARFRMEGRATYTDPSFQDFVETAYGYLNPARKSAAGLRDAVSDKENHIFVTVLPKEKDYSGLLEEMSAEAGFVLYSEQTLHSKAGKTVQLFGWARADRLDAIIRNPGASKVFIGRRI